MRGSITIDGKNVELKANALTLARYQEWFGTDLIKDLKKVDTDDMSGEAVGIMLRFMYVMARQADSTVPKVFDEWADSFTVFPYEECFNYALALWKASIAPNVEPKNQ